MVFAISNQKGGVGKTTSVLNLGFSLSKRGFKVLLIDIDPQSNLTSGLGIQTFHKDSSTEKRKSSYDLLVNKVKASDIIQKSRVENLSVLPSSIELAGAEVEMVNFMSRENTLRKAIEDIRNDYEFILIDCPPSLGLLTINGQVAADKVLIPVQAEYFALEGLGQLVNTVKLVKNNLNTGLDIGGVMLTMFDSRTNLSKDVALELKKFFEDKLFDTVVPRNIKLSEAPSHGLSIFEYEPSSTGAQAYARLADEIIERFAPKKSSELVRPNLGSN